MAFVASNFFLQNDVTGFRKVTNPRPRVWGYRTPDSSLTVSAKGYFNPAASLVLVGDRILIDTVTGMGTANEVVNQSSDVVVRRIAAGVVYCALNSLSALGYWLVTDFGAEGDGVTDDTAAIQACIDAAGAGSTVIFPDGGISYKTGPLLVNAAYGVQILGTGPRGAQLQFYPTGNATNTAGVTTAADPGTCIQFAMNGGQPSGAALQTLCSLKNLSISTGNTSFDKIGVRIVENGSFTMENVSIASFRGGPTGSCGLQTMGHESNIFVNNKISSCNVPIRISRGTQSTVGVPPAISCDGFHFSDMYLIGPLNAGEAGATLPSCCVLIDDGVRINELLFDGTQSWVGGLEGLHWVSPTACGDTQFGVRIENVRKEQGYSAAVQKIFNIDLNATYPLQSVTFTNCKSGEDNTMWYFRNVNDALILGGGYIANIAALGVGRYVVDMQTNNKSLQFIDVRFPAAATLNIAGFADNSATPNGAVPNYATKSTHVWPTSAVWLV